MPKFVSTWTLPPGCKRRRKPSQFPFPSIRSYRHSRQLNLDSQPDHRGSPTSQIRRSDWQVLEEKVGANYKNRFVWSPSYIDALVTRDRDTDANGTLDERLYPQHDANFNVTAITNTGGTVQERYTPDPFGVVTFRDASGNPISASAKDWVFLHQGGQADILGHYDFRNRILSPTLGRWLTNDPLGFDAGDNNFYGYIANGPGNGLDPSGLEELQDPPTPLKDLFGPWRKVLEDLEKDIDKITLPEAPDAKGSPRFYWGIFLPPMEGNNTTIPGHNFVGIVSPIERIIRGGLFPDPTAIAPGENFKSPIVGLKGKGNIFPIGDDNIGLPTEYTIELPIFNLSKPDLKLNLDLYVGPINFKPGIRWNGDSKLKPGVDISLPNLLPGKITIQEPNKGEPILDFKLEYKFPRKKD